MSIIYYILGFCLTLFITVDLIWTTLWVDGGAGPLSNKLTEFVWRMIKKIDNKLLYNIAGPLILSLTLFSWFFLMWLGVALFFAGDPESIVNPTAEGAISWAERFYFTGFNLFTLGIGDYVPKEGFFQIVSALVSGMGMLLLTFAASYVISIISAVAGKRSFARSVSGLGNTSPEFLIKAWNGKDFAQLDLLLSDFNSQISQLTQQNQAFPVLQYYHSEDPEKTSATNIVILDEALTFLRVGLINNTKINVPLIETTQSSIRIYLETITNLYGKEVNEITETPPAMDLTLLKEADIPTISQEGFTERVEKFSKRRNQLLTIVKVDNHEWPNE